MGSGAGAPDPAASPRDANREALPHEAVSHAAAGLIERAGARDRLTSLDALRGLTIAGMIVVNDPGTWKAVYPPLLHAEWNGWTPTDAVFPFFLFIAGASLALSLERRRAAGAPRRALLRRIVGRGALLFAIGLALNAAAFLALHQDRFRILGVLQRIGLCVLVSGVVLLRWGARGAAVAAAALLLSYWGLMRLVPVPGCGVGRLDPRCNLAAFVDRAVLGSHTWNPQFDPEGLLSTLPAIATTLLGALAGEWLRRREPLRARLAYLAAAGGVAAATGLLWARVFPINKSLWTSSYALLMSGLAAVLLAAFAAWIDLAGRRAWAAPLVWLGRNAIAAFLASDVVAGALLAIRVTGTDGRPVPLWRLVYTSVFDRIADARLGSLLFALAYLTLWVAVFGLLYRKRIFLRI